MLCATQQGLPTSGQTLLHLNKILAADASGSSVTNVQSFALGCKQSGVWMQGVWSPTELRRSRRLMLLLCGLFNPASSDYSLGEPTSM